MTKEEYIRYILLRIENMSPEQLEILYFFIVGCPI